VSVVVVATITPKPEFWDEAIAAYEELIAATHDEAGCELYALHEGDGHLVMIEKWTSQEALDAHLTGPAIAAVRAANDGKIAGGAMEILTAHPAGSAHLGSL
jgi:quinol monooxygenase YgiN